MNRMSNLLAWGAAAVAALLAALNWSTLMVSAPLNLLVMQVQAPLGVVMLGLAGVLVALFFLANLRNQIGSLLESRKQLKEIRRVQELADKAEASRIETLAQQMSTEFRLLNERLDALSLPSHSVETDAGVRPLGLMGIVTGRARA